MSEGRNRFARCARACGEWPRRARSRAARSRPRDPSKRDSEDRLSLLQPAFAACVELGQEVRKVADLLDVVHEPRAGLGAGKLAPAYDPTDRAQQTTGSAQQHPRV